MPLRRLYGYALRWSPPQSIHPAAESVLGMQNEFVLWQPSSSGELIFALENQCVWSCGTLPYGEDPPVWVSDCSGYESGCVDSEERRASKRVILSESLSSFLVSYCLYEMQLLPHTALSQESTPARRERLGTLMKSGEAEIVWPGFAGLWNPLSSNRHSAYESLGGDYYVCRDGRLELDWSMLHRTLNSMAFEEGSDVG